MIITIFYPSDHLIHYTVLQFTQFFKTKLCTVYMCVSLHMLLENLVIR
jgi:hypothetical protein